jgi:hypothetical protein
VATPASSSGAKAAHRPTVRCRKAWKCRCSNSNGPSCIPTKDGQPNHPGYVSGELFGANGLEGIPDNPRGRRSMSWELRCKGKGEWNTYDVVCVDGTVKLSINGKFVNGISQSTVRKGYLCLESEGAEIHFRNIKIMELPGGRVTPEQTAPVVK